MVMHGVIEVDLKLAIPLGVVINKLGLRISLVLYAMDQLIAIGSDDGALATVVQSSPDRLFLYLLLGIHGEALAPKSLKSLSTLTRRSSFIFSGMTHSCSIG